MCCYRDSILLVLLVVIVCVKSIVSGRNNMPRANDANAVKCTVARSNVVLVVMVVLVVAVMSFTEQSQTLSVAFELLVASSRCT